jgi:hypothetical protein
LLVQVTSSARLVSTVGAGHAGSDDIGAGDAFSPGWSDNPTSRLGIVAPHWRCRTRTTRRRPTVAVGRCGRSLVLVAKGRSMRDV